MVSHNSPDLTIYPFQPPQEFSLYFVQLGPCSLYPLEKATPFSRQQP